MSDRDPWAGLLDAGEAILWQGRPDSSVSLQTMNLFSAIFGAFFAGFALFWMAVAMQGGGSFWMFGLIHFAVGVGVFLSGVFWDAFRRRHSWYTLTDRRAFIATNLPLQGRTLKSYPIRHDTVLELIDGTPASIHFASRTKRTKNGTREIPVGFERIEEGRKVYTMMRDIQRQARTGA